MTIAIILVVFSVLALLLLLRLAKGHAARISDPNELAGRIRAVDVQAFRNLIDPGEEDYLRRNLSPAQFRTIQRERLRAALDYVFCAAGNAAVLVRVGEAARQSEDPSLAAAGANLVDSAIRLRISAFQVIVKLYAGLLFPGARISALGMAESYERTTRLVFQLSRLQAHREHEAVVA